MKLCKLTIRGFRGIERAEIAFGDNDVLVGPNSAGKSTIIDSLSLVFGRTKMVRDLTEHDFFGSRPVASSRIIIIATLIGFADNAPEQHDGWFRDGRAVPKWWNPTTKQAEPEPCDEAGSLCAQIAFAARFDLEDLEVKTIRYFHDDDEMEDPFDDDVVQQVPGRLYDDIGYYVLPSRRTWEAAASFASDLFRKAVAALGEIPAQAVLDERDRLRDPSTPLERVDGLAPLAKRINEQLAHLMPSPPDFQLRVTATDSDSLLRALVPHYTSTGDVALPVGRHGMGLLSLQAFILLLELGKERRAQGKPFLFAMEEPELHIPPGVQRRLVGQAISIAEQTICTSHSPRVAALYPATSVQLLDRGPGRHGSTPMLKAPLDRNATQVRRKLFHDDRARVIEALMYHSVLIPEGRTEHEWLRLLSNVLETADVATTGVASEMPDFSAVVGVCPVHGGEVSRVYADLCGLRGGLLPLVDGDRAGNDKVHELAKLDTPPRTIIQWQDGWAIEQVIGWILGADQEAVILMLQGQLQQDYDNLDALIQALNVKEGKGRLKSDYLAHGEIASVIAAIPACRKRASALLGTMTKVCLGQIEGMILSVQSEALTPSTSLVRIGV